MITVLVAMIFLPLFSPLRVRAQVDLQEDVPARFGGASFGQTDFARSTAVDFGPDPFSPAMKKRAASKKSDFTFYSPEWKEKSGNENLTIAPNVGPPSVTSQSCDQDPSANDGRILNATIATGESVTRFIIQVTDQAPGSQTSNSPEFQTPSASGSQPFQSRISQFVVGHTFSLRIAMQNAFTNGQTVYGPTLSFTHLGNSSGGGTAPVVVTGDYSNVTQTSANLSWSITPNGTPTRAAMVVWIGSQSAPPQYSKPSEGSDAGFVPSPASISVSGLPAGTVIYYEGLAASINASPTQLLNPSFITGRGGVKNFQTQPGSSATLSITGQTNVQVNQVVNFTALSGQQNVTGSAAWSSSNSGVAQLQSPGVFLAVGAGNTTITANFNGQTASTVLSVNAVPNNLVVTIPPRFEGNDQSLTRLSVTTTGGNGPLSFTWNGVGQTVSTAVPFIDVQLPAAIGDYPFTVAVRDASGQQQVVSSLLKVKDTFLSISAVYFATDNLLQVKVACSAGKSGAQITVFQNFTPLGSLKYKPSTGFFKKGFGTFNPNAPPTITLQSSFGARVDIPVVIR